MRRSVAKRAARSTLVATAFSMPLDVSTSEAPTIWSEPSSAYMETARNRSYVVVSDAILARNLVEQNLVLIVTKLVD
jgi:hypothetical protein